MPMRSKRRDTEYYIEKYGLKEAVYDRKKVLWLVKRLRDHTANNPVPVKVLCREMAEVFGRGSPFTEQTLRAVRQGADSIIPVGSLGNSGEEIHGMFIITTEDELEAHIKWVFGMASGQLRRVYALEDHRDNISKGVPLFKSLFIDIDEDD